MFTGLVETTGVLEGFELGQTAWRLTLRLAGELRGVRALGESIAVDGTCLTLVGLGEAGLLAFEVLEETRRCTHFGSLNAGQRVNLEASLRVGDALGGHFVSGHIDGLGRVRTLKQQGKDTYIFVVPQESSECLVPKGSIAINGVSLTVADVDSDGFGVWLIPHTLATTNLGALEEGDTVNLEYDLLAKYVAKSVACQIPK